MPRKLFSSTSSLPSTALSSTTSITSSTSSSTIPTTFTDNLPLPSIIVFDLDYTLWPFWVDTHVSGPIKPTSPTNNTSMVDRWGEHFQFYDGVPAILHAAKERGITMSLASRTHAPDLARDMLRGLAVVPPGISKREQKDSTVKFQKAIDFFTHMQIYPGSKTTHFMRLQEALRKKEGKDVPFTDMLFFDDEGRNRNVEVELDVTFHLVRDGVTKDEVDRGVRAWRKRNAKNQASQQQRNGQDRGENHVAELEG